MKEQFFFQWLYTVSCIIMIFTEINRLEADYKDRVIVCGMVLL